MRGLCERWRNPSCRRRRRWEGVLLVFGSLNFEMPQEFEIPNFLPQYTGFLGFCSEIFMTLRNMIVIFFVH